jgi:RNA polymerase sigma-32 factor
MSTTLPALSGERNVARYLQEIRKFPLLAADEEFMLAKRWREHGDSQAAHKLVTSHLRLVAKIAMGYRGYGLPLSELISEGNVGMMQAVKRFEPDKGFRLATYAMWWIRASIQEYILHSWSLVKMGTTAAQKKLFFNLRRAKARLQVMDDRQFTQEKIARIATDLGVAEQDVVQMNQRLAAPDHSLNAPLRGDGEGDLEWQDWLVDDTANQEVRLADEQEFVRRKALMDQAMKTLNERERQILIERRLTEDPATLEDLSVKYGVSRERVRQIENRAFEKLQKAVRALTAEEARAIEEARAAGLPALRPSPASLPGPTAPR